jgi:XTP/dITP diphosphohydrolase
MAFQEIVLGTHNRKKAAEMVQLLAPYGLKLLMLDDFPNSIEVEETGETFAENAALKAIAQARHLRRWAIGEDSGLVVDALNGAPGIYSARFAGTNATDEKNNALLLKKLEKVDDDRRSAHYVCEIAVADPEGNIMATSNGKCHGRILRTAAGSGGFGYDPLFEIPEYHLTFAELGDNVKSVLSHRARAMRRVVANIVQLSRRSL